ncbi:NUDIX domain-containing protein [Pseudomonas sp. EZ-C24]|uniref:NUDIX domain-containing protein n=1 Tax=Pseudomonas sp. EZ-C24 TaxID=2753617 RepID=UPI0029344301|nr:NUDIX domain-containing protein [Pseudomonas sp. EZ-C24]
MNGHDSGARGGLHALVMAASLGRSTLDVNFGRSGWPSVIELHSTVICLQAGKVLLVRKEAPERLVPGGKIEPGETQLEAAHRELLEETSLRLTDAQFLGHHVLQAEEHWLYRMATPPSSMPRPSHQIVECRWFSIEEITQISVTPLIQECLRSDYSAASETPTFLAATLRNNSNPTLSPHLAVTFLVT